MKAHSGNAAGIIGAIVSSDRTVRQRARHGPPRYLSLPGIEDWHRHVYERFADVVNIPSFDYISKTDRGWLIIGDHRSEIAARIQVIIERHGIGVGMMVLHAQQMRSQHIPLEVAVDGQVQVLSQATDRLYGTRRENVLYIPVRKFRTDFDKLAELSIVKPRPLWEGSRIVSHEHDRFPCFYCSANEINPSEVIVDINGPRFGLSRDYSLGFTFAPFGNPVHVIHFLAWDCAENPFNMNRTPMTVSDLVEMTRLVNISIQSFFAGTETPGVPVIDGVSNGWAGNSIYHQHFQFFRPEYESPVKQETLVSRKPLLERDDVRINRLAWETPVYKISADDSINVGLVGNDMAGIWRLLGGGVKVQYRQFHDGYSPTENEKVPVHTQNLYVPGNFLGREAYVLLRDKRSVDYKPRKGEYVNRAKNRRVQPKANIGVLEATGTMIVDDAVSFGEISEWEPTDISTQIDKIARAVCPDRKQVARFERSIRDLFPQ